MLKKSLGRHRDRGKGEVQQKLDENTTLIRSPAHPPRRTRTACAPTNPSPSPPGSSLLPSEFLCAWRPEPFFDAWLACLCYACPFPHSEINDLRREKRIKDLKIQQLQVCPGVTLAPQFPPPAALPPSPSPPTLSPTSSLRRCAAFPRAPTPSRVLTLPPSDAGRHTERPREGAPEE